MEIWGPRHKPGVEQFPSDMQPPVLEIMSVTTYTFFLEQLFCPEHWPGQLTPGDEVVQALVHVFKATAARAAE